jgi:predicted small lipoprotein YifL
MKSFRVLAILAAALLAGCTTKGPFPSLAQRPDERLSIDEPVREAPHIADDSALRVRINTLLAEARAGNTAFERDYDAAARTASRAGPEGSDSWMAAQQAVSRVEAARGRTGNAVAELHQLVVTRADRPISPDDQAALEAAIDQADGIVAAQQARLNRLSR